MTGSVGVAISTTGDPHRMPLLEQAVEHWMKAMPDYGVVFVTVDGDEAACARVDEVLGHLPQVVYQVGQGADVREGKMGVAVNKNTGIELLMDSGVEHLFLSDDDTWPLSKASLAHHTELPAVHSMVCWGGNRLHPRSYGTVAAWTWPRGVMLYTHRSVIEQVGGMDERFGPGGHEHAEFSRRIFQAGLTPCTYPSPNAYALKTGKGAKDWWHCEDMKKQGESQQDLGERRKRLTTIKRAKGDWTQIGKIMSERDGDTSKVSYQAYLNGRESATLVSNL